MHHRVIRIVSKHVHKSFTLGSAVHSGVARAERAGVRSVTLCQVLIEKLAVSREGVLTRADALRGGLTRRQIQYRVRSGEWACLHPGVYPVGGREADQRAGTRAAVAWAGPAAVASGLTAAWWWGLRNWAPGAAEVTVPRNRSAAAYRRWCCAGGSSTRWT